MAVWTGDALDPTVFSLPQVDMADVGTSKNKLILGEFLWENEIFYYLGKKKKVGIFIL